MVDGVISLICIISMICKISKKLCFLGFFICRWLVLLLYFLMEILVVCYSATAFFISESDIAQIHNAVVRMYFSNIIPAQYLELLVFCLVLICFFISFCQHEPVAVHKENTSMFCFHVITGRSSKFNTHCYNDGSA